MNGLPLVRHLSNRLPLKVTRNGASQFVILNWWHYDAWASMVGTVSWKYHKCSPIGNTRRKMKYILRRTAKWLWRMNKPELGQDWEQWRGFVNTEKHFFHTIINFLINWVVTTFLCKSVCRSRKRCVGEISDVRRKFDFSVTSTNSSEILPTTVREHSYPMYVRHLESKERLRIQPAQLFNFSWWVMWCVQ